LDGADEFARHECQGAADVRRIFARDRLSCYGQPGSSWASQAIIALPQISIAPVYVDEGRHVGLDGKPFWYAGSLNVYNMGPNFTRMKLHEDDLESANAHVDEIIHRLEAEGGGLVSIMYHPCEFVHEKFWDAVNFARGANPPPDEWKLPPQRPAEETEKAFERFGKYIDHIKSLGVHFVTASDLPTIYDDRAHKEGITEAELSDIAKRLADEKTIGIDYQVLGDKSLSPADQFELLTARVGEVIEGKVDNNPLVVHGLIGPDSSPGSIAASGATISWPAFCAAVADLRDYLRVHHRVPPRVFIGPDSVAPADFLRGLAAAYQFEHEHGKPLQDGVRMGKHFDVLTERHVAENSPALFEWKIHREGFVPLRIMDVARLQAWTLKPALRTTRAVAGDPAKPTSRTERTIEGWTVRIDDRFFQSPNTELCVRVLKSLEARLADINAVMQPDRLEKIHRVPIVLDLTHGKLAPMQYHPSREWLVDHGYAADLARCVHIPRGTELLEPRQINVQPWCLLHELAHGYHHQVLGFDDPRIIAAYKKYKVSGHGDSTLLVTGQHVRHYALTNEKEFFAEMTEAYFGVNDFFPFNRAELMTAEPEIYKMLLEIWGAVKAR
jgi:hypothetical protein